MKQQTQKGFTLIELVVVIVILGILAATALPRFIDLSSDARKATLAGIKGALQSAAVMAYAKASFAGQTDATGTVTINGQSISLAYAYPTAASINLLMQEAAGATYAFTAGATSTTYTLRANCLVTYTQVAAAGNMPAVAITDGGC